MLYNKSTHSRTSPQQIYNKKVIKSKQSILDFNSLWTCGRAAANHTRRPASADRTARRQFQATGQPVSRMQATNGKTTWLPRYEAKYVQRRCFQCGSVPLRSDIKGTELPPANILIPLERQLIALQRCRGQFLYNETLQQTFRPLLSKLSKKTTHLGT